MESLLEEAKQEIVRLNGEENMHSVLSRLDREGGLPEPSSR
jgi:hypothetical protein